MSFMAPSANLRATTGAARRSSRGSHLAARDVKMGHVTEVLNRGHAKDPEGANDERPGKKSPLSRAPRTGLLRVAQPLGDCTAFKRRSGKTFHLAPRRLF